MLRFARSANISRRFSVLRTPRQSSASVLQQYEQQNKFDEIEREVESLLEKTEKENVEEALKVLSRIEKQHKLKHPLFMSYWRGAQIMQLSGDLNKAKELIEHAIAITPKNNDTSQLVPRIKMTHANIIKGLGKYKDANKILLDALSTFGAPTLDNSIYIATAYYELAEYFVGNNNVQQAISYLEQAISLSEGLHGWSAHVTTQATILLARLYFDNDRVDLGIICAEKALIGMELHSNYYNAQFITLIGTYLARAYERKKHYTLAQNTVTRTFHMLQRRGDDGDPDTFNECLFRTENLVGAIRFHRGEFAVALKAFENVQKSYVDSGVYEKWKVRDAASAEFEYAYLLYFRGVTWVSVGQYEKAYQDLENALEIFKRGGYTSWADQCEMNIKQGRELEQQQAKK